MASQVGICNQAINLVGGTQIVSIDDEIDEATICKSMYDDIRDLVLEDADWTFATKRYLLTPEIETPAWGYAHQFTILPEVLRIINIADNPDELNGESDLDWRREENLILCDISANLYMKGVKQITDESRFSAGYKQAFIYKLAAHLAIPIAGSRTLHDNMEKLYHTHKDMAVTNDGRQGRSDRINSSRYRSVR